MLWKLIEVKKFHTNFHDVLERGGGGGVGGLGRGGNTALRRSSVNFFLNKSN